MRIILLERISNLGDIGKELNVKSGYARNFLIPRAKAVLATKKNIESFQARRTLLESEFVRISAEVKLCVSKIKQIGSIVIISKSGVSGKLFGSIGRREIAASVVEAGVNITKYNVRLPNGNIRYLGDHSVVIQFHHGIRTNLNVRIVGSESS